MARTNERRVVAQNRKARHNYFIDSTMEAGIMLLGTEVKSLRTGQASLNDAYAGEKDGELYLINSHIPEYAAANRFNHEPRRPRKLLLRRRELDRILGSIRREGATAVPLSLYFNERGMAKVELGVAHGKKKHEKRETQKKREWNREKARVMRARG
jgi:SsrA-binding protein